MFQAQHKKLPPVLPDITLLGFRVNMRPPVLEDWPEWARVRGANKDHLRPFEPAWGRDCLSEDFFERRLARQARSWEQGKAEAFLIFKNNSSVLIGGMNINNICRGAAQFASLGYWIDQTHQGQGYMAEALQLTIKHCFEDLCLHRIQAACIPENKRSMHLLVRAGFTKEGFAEKYLQINGRWQDHILFGLTQEDWEIQSEA